MRKTRAKDSPVIPDPRYKDITVSKFVNSLMISGKKSLAYGIFYGAMDIIEKKSDQPSLETFKAALNNVTPSVEVKSRRVGGSTFQVPTQSRPTKMGD